MKSLTAASLLAILPLLVNCAGMRDPSAPALPAARHKLGSSPQPSVLFVGNSFSQDVPPEFARIATERGRQVRTDKSTTGGWTLAQHAGCRGTLEKIRSGNWDVVILQEQSLMPARSHWVRRFQMRPALAKLASEVRAAGAVPLLMQTWGYRNGDPSQTNDDFHKMTERLRQGTRTEAARVKLDVVPVGDVWQNEVGQGRADELFDGDGYHPTRIGNQTTAQAVFDALFADPDTQDS